MIGFTMYARFKTTVKPVQEVRHGIRVMLAFTSLSPPCQIPILWQDFHCFVAKIVEMSRYENIRVSQILLYLLWLTVIYRRVSFPCSCVVFIIHVVPTTLTPSSINNWPLSFKSWVSVITVKR